MAEQLYMLSLGLDLGRLMRAGFAEHINMREVDTGYLVHMQLRQLFGDDAPGVFRIEQSSRQSGGGKMLKVLAYSHKPASVLKEQADMLADPVVYAACDWNRFAQKAMPQSFAEGRRLGFELRASPVVRLASARTYKDKAGQDFKIKKGAEVDVFVKVGWEQPDKSLSREQVYGDWLREHFARVAGAEIDQIRLKAFQRQRFLRREHGQSRKGHRVEGPDALFVGELTVKDSAVFGKMLARGIGRHRSFGFGMLLLKAAG